MLIDGPIECKVEHLGRKDEHFKLIDRSGRTICGTLNVWRFDKAEQYQIMKELVQAFNDSLEQRNKLDTAWKEINALGGYYDEGDEYGRGFNEAIGSALDIIESLGGMDPVKRKKRGTNAD
mgnify:CR=1 FL=1